jgi:hypothetical protein
MSNILQNKEIPYLSFSRRLFSNSRQELIPFLGAGVSISGRTFDETKLSPKFPKPEAVTKVADELGLTNQARTFLEVAVLLACVLQDAQQSTTEINEEKFFEHLQGARYPPSGGELARLFSNLSQYSTLKSVVSELGRILPLSDLDSDEKNQILMLKLLSRVTGIGNPPDPLASITSYYETQMGRRYLWEDLSAVISRKIETTGTHLLVAEAARYSLENERALDYLIVTTNYDCLMEKALDDLGVPYIAIVTRKSDQKVVVRLSESIPDARKLEDDFSNQYPDKFMIRKPRNLGSLAIIYKIHGCLNPKATIEDDGIVISDSDYVNYISQMTNHGTIPVYISDLMREKPFLFLGYSLRDWNVRSIWETMRKKRDPDVNQPDFSVTKFVADYEKVFLQRNNVTVFNTDLNSFVKGIILSLPESIINHVAPYFPEPMLKALVPDLPDSVIKDILPRLAATVREGVLPLLKDALREELTS